MVPLNRTIVGWKQFYKATLTRAFKALNRTIVGWKRVKAGGPEHHFKAPLNRTIVGWKRTCWSATPARPRFFKSHHSGMETTASRSQWEPLSHFKSHHSGMETVEGQVAGRRRLAFKSHHSGMETRPRPVGFAAAESAFKSHHSGMETRPSLMYATGCGPLNRTIVGWKHRLVVGSRILEVALNRTIVGWKRALRR